ncbi:hypothetical protein V6N11_039656 [Hibiscus sabdariffa]|uniref:Uncharacterized protein n=1 Tax=Hibiscus sabdariffa TaxID=183260 RepID=A0ABR2SNE3_9ROSI
MGGRPKAREEAVDGALAVGSREWWKMARYGSRQLWCMHGSHQGACIGAVMVQNHGLACSGAGRDLGLLHGAWPQG